MILITGATGQLGRAVLHTLTQQTAPTQLAALVRDASKAADLQAQGISVRVGDYGDPASLARAMAGITKVLLIAGGDAPDALQQHYNVVDAARQAGVQCLAYTGRALREPSTLVNKLMARHFQTEDYIRASGLPYIFFQNILYMDVLPLFVGPQVLATGITLPAGQGKVAYALRSEMGEAIANVLLAGNCTNQTYRFTGSQAYSFADVAATLTALSGQAVGYNPVETSEFKAQMRGRGVPEPAIERTVGFLSDIANGQEAIVSPDLAQALGRPPTALQEGIRQLFKL